ncbi:Sensor protein gacS [Diplodia seriata]|uniref:Sensor protein gacS n=1 Tax=Diplodia seriata TaxID=420778 RepID=A0A1S8BCD0_9PEZI|nr:Sensor protein gacS [Diplodia seriata]
MGDPLSVAASIAGLVALADIVFVRAFKYAKEAKGANKEISALANELQSLSGVLHSLHLRISGLGNDEQAHTATYRSDLVDSCIRLLVTVRDKLQEHKPGEQEQGPSRSLRKLKWPFSAKETKSLITDIERHKSTLTMALSADSMVAAQRILSSQEKLLSDVDEIKTDLKRRRTFESNLNDFVMSATLGEKQKEVLQFFGTVDPTERHQTSVSLRHPNTGLWLLESDEVQEWLNDSSARLWLSGIPGAGKTVLASAVIEAAVEQCCLDPDKGLAYFYCDYKDEQSQELTKILGSLAAQLARQNTQSFQVLEKYYDALNLPGKPSVSSAKPSLIQVLQSMSTHFSEVFIVIDALDECGQNVTAVAESLACLNAKDGCNIKTLLLSRDEYAIRCCLQDEFTHVSIAARNHDLKLYVASQIETRMSSGRLRIRNPALKDEIMEELVNGSKGIKSSAADAEPPPLPVRRRSPPPPPPAPPETTSPANPPLSSSPAKQTQEEEQQPRLLLVEDNMVNLKLLQTFLKKQNYTNLTAAENGQIAVDAVINLGESNRCFDVIFMDISMPVMDGFAATVAIRRFERERRDDSGAARPPLVSTRPPAYIVALTGLAGTKDEERAYAAGMDLVLTKPVKFKELKEVLEKWGKGERVFGRVGEGNDGMGS